MLLNFFFDSACSLGLISVFIVFFSIVIDCYAAMKSIYDVIRPRFQVYCIFEYIQKLLKDYLKVFDSTKLLSKLILTRSVLHQHETVTHRCSAKFFNEGHKPF